MSAKTVSSNDLLVIELTAAETALVNTACLNERIRQSMPFAVLVCRQGQTQNIAVERALSRLNARDKIEIISFSTSSLPILFSFGAWRDLGELQGEPRSAESVFTDFINAARKARLFTVIQIGK